MSDLISRQAAVDALDVLCQEHRYKITGKSETYSQYNEAWQDALDRAEGAIGNLPSADRAGEWIEMDVLQNVYDFDGNETWASIMQCSQCGFRRIAIEGIMTQYNHCPNCGRLMKGGDSDD